MNIEEIEIENTNQSLFDNFNGFIMSNDRKVFNKLVARTLLYDEVKDIPGDIVECGVFKGSGFYTFLKLKKIMNPNSLKRVVGFDFFDTKDLLSNLDNLDKKTMSLLFNGRNFEHEKDFKSELYSKLKLDGFKDEDFELVKGDISLTSKKYIEDNPGFKISLLYIDLDLEVPTYNTLKNFWDRLSRGGIIVLDEYAHSKWSESKGVDKFLNEMNLEIKNLNYICPSAYIKKTN
jgi:hypothetical protein